MPNDAPNKDSSKSGGRPARKPRAPRQPLPERPARERVTDFQEVATGFSAEQAVIEAERCLQCKKPLCVQGCPVGIDIPAFIKPIVEGDFAAAGRRIKEDTNLPAVCGRVCPQESQCEEVCILGKKGEPVAIGALERFVADYGSQEDTHAEPSGKRVAVVGGGPAGLTAAGELARLGHQVTVYEALHETGGVLVYGIPEFRLPKEIVRREVEALEGLGVDFRMNVVIGRSLSIDDLFNEGADAVFVGTGAGLPYFLDIPGENLNGVYTANEFLTRVNLMKAYRFPDYHTPVYVGKRVAVFGGGNTAMDAARTALRMGPESVKLIYRRSEAEMPARLEEVHHGKDEGVEFVTLCSPVEFLDDGESWVGGVKVIHMELGEPDASGRRRPLPIAGSEEVIDIDMAIIAIGNGPNTLIPQTTPGLETSSHGTILAEERTGHTHRRGVFAGGDVVTGAATVIQAMGAGKTAAAAIHEFLTSDAERVAHERFLGNVDGYFRTSDDERTDRERLELLSSLGVPAPESFLNRRLPHWRARLDELLDPESLDMFPIHMSHAHVRYVRGAIQELPEAAKGRLFRAKLVGTGLIDAVRELYRASGSGELSGEYTVSSVELRDDARQSVRVVLFDGGRRFAFDLLRMSPQPEIVFSAVASALGVPHATTVPFTSPRGEDVALCTVPRGENLADDTAFPPEYLRAHWPPLVAELGRQEALADLLGVAVREPSYLYDTDGETLRAAEHLELFHYTSEQNRGESPALVSAIEGALPDDPARQAQVATDILKHYEAAYREQWGAISAALPRIEVALRTHESMLSDYTDEPAQRTIEVVRAQARRNAMVNLTRMYEVHLPELWESVKDSIWAWRREGQA